MENLYKTSIKLRDKQIKCLSLIYKLMINGNKSCFHLRNNKLIVEEHDFFKDFKNNGIRNIYYNKNGLKIYFHSFSFTYSFDLTCKLNNKFIELMNDNFKKRFSYDK